MSIYRLTIQSEKRETLQKYPSLLFLIIINNNHPSSIIKHQSSMFNDDDDDDDDEKQPTLTGKDENLLILPSKKNQGTAPVSVCHNSASCLDDDLDFSPNPAGSRFSGGTNPSNWILSPIFRGQCKIKHICRNHHE